MYACAPSLVANGGPGISAFRDFAPFKIWPNSISDHQPCQKLELGQKIYASRGLCEMYVRQVWNYDNYIYILVSCCSAVLYFSSSK